MAKKSSQTKLSELIALQGLSVDDIWFEPTFGYLPGGWFCEISVHDEDGELSSKEYHLGKDYQVAAANIENHSTVPPFPTTFNRSESE